MHRLGGMDLASCYCLWLACINCTTTDVHAVDHETGKRLANDGRPKDSQPWFHWHELHSRTLPTDTYTTLRTDDTDLFAEFLRD
ncbi:hypothetical protein B0T22DRAFT_466699 [Podospora appendiculata]|uniref:Secreted protein n=1 Tax=Podospora appendiculata TaxID=314037 RepID=A0AAE0X621_9PEZI|nr:hypothetical protein B0T22DRAFT_466699 [Podospora appendiculata]